MTRRLSILLRIALLSVALLAGALWVRGLGACDEVYWTRSTPRSDGWEDVTDVTVLSSSGRVRVTWCLTTRHPQLYMSLWPPSPPPPPVPPPASSKWVVNHTNVPVPWPWHAVPHHAEAAWGNGRGADWAWLGLGFSTSTGSGFGVSPYSRGSTWEFMVPYWLPLLAGAVLAWRWWAGRRRARRDARAGVVACGRCGYDLRATPGRCPECGAVSTVAS
ncbi:MAG TPA: hypothetical protein VF796_26580 [Humisphaera sp.]